MARQFDYLACNNTYNMALEVFKNILSQSKKDKQLIGIRTYKDNDVFWAGYITEFNEEFIIFQHISKYGEKDGLMIEKMENIESIEMDDDYLNALQFLIDLPNKIGEQTIQKLELPQHPTWQIDMLNASAASGKIIAVDISRNLKNYGIMTNIDESFLAMRLVGDGGEDEGIVVYKIADINSIEFDTLQCRKRQKLYEWWHKRPSQGI